MVKKTKDEVEEEVVEEAVEEVAEKPAKKDKNSATVTWQGQSRTYTREIHGDNFADLAEEFAEKKGGTVA